MDNMDTFISSKDGCLSERDRSPKEGCHGSNIKVLPLPQIRLCSSNVKFSRLFTNTRLARTCSWHRLLRTFGSAATMLLAVLLHLLIFHLLTASVPDASTPVPPKDKSPPLEHKAKPRKDTEYKIKYIKHCPAAGYFFKREASANALEPYTCNLCFCQGDHVAVCWKRDNRRCDKESFHYQRGAKKREKRSPGFSDIFFRDASRDVFNKNEKTQCKPYESSFSDDCPPADWCTGCTVCDCDANGHWDCHLLSFCPDDKTKSKKPKGPSPSWPFLPPFIDKTKEKLINSSTMEPTTRPTVNTKKPNNKNKPEIQRGGKRKQPQQKRFVKKKPTQKVGKAPNPKNMKTQVKYTNVTPKKPNSTKNKIIKKNIAHKPVQIKKSNKVALETEIARKMMKTVMQNLRKSVSAKVKTMTEIARQNANNVRNQKAWAKVNKPKNVKKRQIKKPTMKPPVKKPSKKPPTKKSNTKSLMKTMAPVKKPIYRVKTTKKPYTRQNFRNKRDVAVTEPLGNSAELNTTNSAELNTTNSTQINNTNSADLNNTNSAELNTTNSTDSSLILTVIPVDSNSLAPDDGNSSFTLIENTTFPGNTYYKYTLVSEEPRTKLEVKFEDATPTQFNKTETIFNLLGEQVNSNVSTEKRHIKNNDANKIINLTKINPEENELKFSKWSNLKIPNNKIFISESNIKLKSLTKLMSQTTKTILQKPPNRTPEKKVEKTLNHRKYNMVKLIHSKCMFPNCNNNININTPTKSKGDFHGYITKVLNNSHKNNTTKRRRKPGVLKYLKRIFNKIFKGKRAPDKMNKHQLIQTLCENFGPCSKVNRKDKVLLNLKLSELDKETTKILKTVKIIKGLLKLFELPKTANGDDQKQGNFRNDIQILNNILKGLYSENDQTLTETQRTQIGYIKTSTQDFIESVSKFASLLNELIVILTKDHTNRFKNKAKNYFSNRNLSKDNPFQSLRNLLVRFNLVQNTFMKQMYEQLNNFENKINEKPKVSEVKDLNNSVAIESISRDIIHNLRKLKRLAQTVSFRGKGMTRTKRHTGRDDDATEYLLMMMEYLIKQNHALDAEPVNDGIDLLIEAIKNAPDIKAIKKKVLDYTPVIHSDTTTTSTPSSLSTIIVEDPEPISDDESPSDSDATENKTSSSEDSGKTKTEDNESKLKENKEFIDVITDDEKEFEDKFQFDRRVESDKTEEITETAFFRRLGAEENIMHEAENTPETSTLRNTIVPLEMETTNDKTDNRDDFNVEKTLAIESNNLDNKLVEYSETTAKKTEMFTGDIDEDSFLSSTTSTTESEIPTSTLPYYSTQPFEAQKSITKMMQQTLESSDDIKNSDGDKKARLKWIEENFGKESEKGFIDSDEMNSTLSITSVTAQTLTAKTIDKIDDSFITRDKGDVNDNVNEKEIAEESEKVNVRDKPIENNQSKSKRVQIKINRSEDETETKKTQAKLSAEEVMFRKQMELLNSLDYGTEKAEVYEVDSKDSNVDEPNTGDSFPSYYV